MFYSSPLSGEFVDFKLPGEFSNIKLENMILIEPYIFAVGIDFRGRDCFYRYDLASKEVYDMQPPNMSHDNFKLCSSGREFVFIVGSLSNKICEKFDILKNEWSLLPPLPEYSLSTF